jgi:hypothetical protein
VEVLGSSWCQYTGYTCFFYLSWQIRVFMFVGLACSTTWPPLFVSPFAYHRMRHVQGVSIMRRETSRVISSHQNKEKHNTSINGCPKVSGFFSLVQRWFQQKKNLNYVIFYLKLT